MNCCNQHEKVVRIAVTTDVHGMIFPYDFIARTATDHSLAHIYNYVSEQREKEDTLLILLDNGDFLQGQPTVYYYNFIDTASPHLSARVMNYMQYNAGTVGNHDVEAGPAVYNRIRTAFEFPWLAANAIRSESGESYFEPYTLIKAGDMKIAVLGLITPGIPNWLPENLWPDMEFKDMVETAQEWIPRIIKKEEPDLVVGLFHSGTDSGYGGNPAPYLNENAVLAVAGQVPGFDIIFAGHDHQVSNHWVVNMLGDSVLVIDPGSHARYAGEATIAFGRNGQKKITGKLVPMAEYAPSQAFISLFKEDYNKVKTYLQDTITWLTEDIIGLDALFGTSTMMSLIHRVQLDLSGADISSAAGIDYTINVSQEPGDRVKIHGFTDGSSFCMEDIYNVAINSYRGNGGGGHLTQGAGIAKEDLPDRVNWSTDMDLRYYLMKTLTEKDTLKPMLMDNWDLIPASWVLKASRSDKKLF